MDRRTHRYLVFILVELAVYWAVVVVLYADKNKKGFFSAIREIFEKTNFNDWAAGK